MTITLRKKAEENNPRREGEEEGEDDDGRRTTTTTTQGAEQNNVRYQASHPLYHPLMGGWRSNFHEYWGLGMDDGRWEMRRSAESRSLAISVALWSLAFFLSSLCTCVVFSSASSSCCCRPRLLHANSSARSVVQELEELWGFTGSPMMQNGVQ